MSCRLHHLSQGMEFLSVCKELDIQRLCLRRIMSVTMAVRAQSDAVPDAIPFLHAEDVVHVEETGIVLCLPAAIPFTAVGTRKHCVAHVWIALDLGAEHGAPLTTIATDVPRIPYRTSTIWPNQQPLANSKGHLQPRDRAPCGRPAAKWSGSCPSWRDSSTSGPTIPSRSNRHSPHAGSARSVRVPRGG
ncbi:hypothetical protein R8510_04773 [Ralstonia chuxiongensis]|nr:hypothetical protein R8510_04773 [Ralstonia chuxiongensis]